jgi:hypothetical protein
MTSQKNKLYVVAVVTKIVSIRNLDPDPLADLHR